MTVLPEPVDPSIGLNIRARRRRIRLSQSALAAATGLTARQVRRYESGADDVPASILAKLAEALHVAVASLTETGDAKNALGLDAPGASELLEAFVQISDSNVRKAVVRLIRAMATSDVDTGPM